VTRKRTRHKFKLDCFVLWKHKASYTTFKNFKSFWNAERKSRSLAYRHIFANCKNARVL